ncbi:hypothetical protein PIB30_011391 [Stylosanthes scabra]|uniref:Uncharacterized protein n=1 Tax=Stylosanthes scabra TaxID=79078 RepID=A0ABU6Y4D5_9FABA|nr:hypothetical protein [Stylosanthes scabra]
MRSRMTQSMDNSSWDGSTNQERERKSLDGTCYCRLGVVAVKLKTMNNPGRWFYRYRYTTLKTRSNRTRLSEVGLKRPNTHSLPHNTRTTTITTLTFSQLTTNTPPSIHHNSLTGAPIAAPPVATRSSRPHLRIHTKFEFTPMGENEQHVPSWNANRLCSRLNRFVSKQRVNVDFSNRFAPRLNRLGLYSIYQIFNQVYRVDSGKYGTDSFLDRD